MSAGIYVGCLYAGDKNFGKYISKLYFYEGEFKDAKMHGLGTMSLYCGDTYTGGFANDKRNGKGTYNYLDGEKYEGDWLNDN